MSDAMSAVNGPASWLTLALLLAGFLGLALLFLASARISHRYPTRALRLRCPASGRDIVLTGIYDRSTGQWINVAHCSEAGFPGCDRGCLNLAGGRAS